MYLNLYVFFGNDKSQFYMQNKAKCVQKILETEGIKKWIKDTF